MSGAIAKPVLRQSPAAGKTTHVDLQRQTNSAGAKSADALNAFPLQPGVLKTGIAIVLGQTTTVIHGLKRLPKTLMSVPYNVTVTVGQYPVPIVTASDVNQISFQGFGTFTFDAWLY